MVQSVSRLLVACSLWFTVHSFNIDYSSAFQCNSVGLAWATTNASETQQFEFPLYLNILPFNSTAIIQRIENWDETTEAGKAVLGFPLAEGTQFLLGVTDNVGRGVGRTSSIQTVLPSNNSSCLPAKAQTTQLVVKFGVTPANSDGCPSLTVSYNESSNPSIFFFAPGHRPFNVTDEDIQGSSGSVKTPKGEYTSFSEIVVLFKDENGIARTSPLMVVGGTDDPTCSPPVDVVSTSPYNPIGYHSRIAALVIAFVLTGVVAIFIIVFVTFWHFRRPGKVHDEESAEPPSPGIPTEKGSNVSTRSLSVRTDRDPTEAIESLSDGLPSARSTSRRRPALYVSIHPPPPRPESGKVTVASMASGIISDSPVAAGTGSNKRRNTLRKPITPNSGRKRRPTDKNIPPSSFSTNSTGAGSSETALRKGSLVSDVTMTDENLIFPDIDPRPDSPTVPSIYLDSTRPTRKLRRSKSQYSNRSSRRSYRDYAMLVEDMPSRRSTMSAMLPRSKARRRSLPSSS